MSVGYWPTTTGSGFIGYFPWGKPTELYVRGAHGTPVMTGGFPAGALVLLFVLGRSTHGLDVNDSLQLEWLRPGTPTPEYGPWHGWSNVERMTWAEAGVTFSFGVYRTTLSYTMQGSTLVVKHDNRFSNPTPPSLSDDVWVQAVPFWSNRGIVRMAGWQADRVAGGSTSPFPGLVSPGRSTEYTSLSGAVPFTGLTYLGPTSASGSEGASGGGWMNAGSRSATITNSCKAYLGLLTQRRRPGQAPPTPPSWRSYPLSAVRFSATLYDDPNPAGITGFNWQAGGASVAPAWDSPGSNFPALTQLPPLSTSVASIAARVRLYGLYDGYGPGNAPRLRYHNPSGGSYAGSWSGATLPGTYDGPTGTATLPWPSNLGVDWGATVSQYIEPSAASANYLCSGGFPTPVPATDGMDVRACVWMPTWSTARLSGQGTVCQFGLAWAFEIGNLGGGAVQFALNPGVSGFPPRRAWATLAEMGISDAVDACRPVWIRARAVWATNSVDFYKSYDGVTWDYRVTKSIGALPSGFGFSTTDLTIGNGFNSAGFWGSGLAGHVIDIDLRSLDGSVRATLGRDNFPPVFNSYRLSPMPTWSGVNSSWGAWAEVAICGFYGGLQPPEGVMTFTFSSPPTLSNLRFTADWGLCVMEVAINGALNPNPNPLCRCECGNPIVLEL